MLNKPAISGALLFSTALYAVPAYAQVQDPQEEATAADTQDTTGTQTGQPEEASQEDVDISTPGAGSFDDDVIVVKGRFIPEPIRNTTQVVSVLSAEDIARSGDGDIASSLERVTGLSVDSGGFVYVRGLGDRYSQALLNGSPLPSPEPLKRVVPLDIFPTSVLSSAVVQKSYSVNYPGEFGGGVINLTTSAIPDESFLTIGGSVAANTETTGQLGYTHFGSDSDFTGFDDGSRDIPTGLAAAFNAGVPIEFNDVFSEDDLEGFATSLLNAPTTLLQRNDNIPANFGLDISGGISTDIGATRFGVIANLGYSNTWMTRDAIQQAGTRAAIADDARTVRTDNNIVVSGLLGLGAEFDEHKVRFTNLYIRDSLKQSRLSAADNLGIGDIDPSTPPDLLRQRTNWIERQLIDSQFIGEFEFGDLAVDIRGAYANSQREAPYERNFVYRFDEDADDYVNSLTRNPETATITFSDLNEDIWSGSIDVAYNIPSSVNMIVSAGYGYSDTTRDAFRRDFIYRPSGTLPFGVTQLRPDFLVSDATIQLFDIQLQEANTAAGSQAYEAGLEVHGAYLKLEVEPIEYVKVDVGVRYEDATQQVVALDIFNDGTVEQTPPLNNDYWLPAATVTWNFVEDMQLRFNASKTIARPQFRELARPQYLDTDSGRIFFGNPFLQDSELFNAEARYEWYFGDGERMSVAGFYKKIDNPVEPVAFIPGGGGLQTTFANAPEAELYGAELEVLKYIPLDTVFDSDFWSGRRLVLIGNYTFTESELKVGANDETILNDNLGFRPASQVFIDGSPLTGQSKHLANVQIGIEDTESLSQYTFLMRYASDRVTARGPITGGLIDPDLVESPGVTIDFVARQGVTLFGRELELKLEARNITGQDYREFQQGEVLILNNAYDIGTTFKFGVSTTF
ncbi:TonB-dependent receptor [Sphingorhabdus sp. Alg239-R122]|uniref:TonB-dependent receptor domain-containing protein n=1 Tax=Sphingorhabdus sp. Alg239-R122 TaxID=2305989 RepID=UPI0013D9BE4D|nr:TonB-dependent receptor [Sphingorhabdus sp. Alg239-R122]